VLRREQANTTMPQSAVSSDLQEDQRDSIQR
jgi:hypothetical protein